MRSIPNNIYRRLDRLIDEGAVAWAVTIELRSGEAIYLTSARRAFDRKGRTYYPFPLTIDEIADSGEGDLPSTTLTLDNTTRYAMTYLETPGLWNGARVIMELVLLDLASEDLLRIDANIELATANDDAVTLTLGQPPLFDRPYPSRRWIRGTVYPGIPRNRQ